MNVVDQLDSAWRDKFVTVLRERNPRLLASLVSKDVPTFREWETVEEILADAVTEHVVDADYDTDKEGAELEYTLAAFINAFPNDSLPDSPHH